MPLLSEISAQTVRPVLFRSTCFESLKAHIALIAGAFVKKKHVPIRKFIFLKNDTK